MKKLLSLLRGLWKKEPVLVGSIIPLAATIGVLTQDQASAIVSAITGTVAIVGQLLAAFKVRSVVTSPATVAKRAVAAAGGLTVSSSANITVAPGVSPAMGGGTAKPAASTSSGGLLGAVKRLLGRVFGK